MKIARSRKKPCPGALHQRLDYWLVDADAVVGAAAASAGGVILSDAAARTTIPILRRVRHPLNGLRPLPHLISGMCDHIVDASGRVVPVRIVERDGVAVADVEAVVDVREIG